MQELNKKKPTGYNTALKFMQIMTEKGLLRRDTSDWRHVYEPAAAKQNTQRVLVDDLVDKAFSGSAKNLVMGALSSDKIPTDELSAIRQLIDELEEKQK